MSNASDARGRRSATGFSAMMCNFRMNLEYDGEVIVADDFAALLTASFLPFLPVADLDRHVDEGDDESARAIAAAEPLCRGAPVTTSSGSTVLTCDLCRSTSAVEGRGRELFELMRANDLEGI